MLQGKVTQGPLKDFFLEMTKDGWWMSFYDKETETGFWQKKLTSKKKTIQGKVTPEWEEFIKEYRTINKNGSYAKTLIRKYNLVLKEHRHEDIMSNLREYKKHLSLFTSKPPLQVGTYLNQNRFMDTWEVIKTDFSTKWIDDRLRERNVDNYAISCIKTEIDGWNATHGKLKDMTIGVLDQIIDKYT